MRKPSLTDRVMRGLYLAFDESFIDAKVRNDDGEGMHPFSRQDFSDHTIANKWQANMRKWRAWKVGGGGCHL